MTPAQSLQPWHRVQSDARACACAFTYGYSSLETAPFLTTRGCPETRRLLQHSRPQPAASVSQQQIHQALAPVYPASAPFYLADANTAPTRDTVTDRDEAWTEALMSYPRTMSSWRGRESNFDLTNPPSTTRAISSLLCPQYLIMCIHLCAFECYEHGDMDRCMHTRAHAHARAHSHAHAIACVRSVGVILHVL